MQKRLQTMMVGLFISFFCLVKGDLMASERGVEPKHVPQSYQMNGVMIQITRHPSRPNFPIQQLTIHGNGHAKMDHGKSSASFTYPTKDVLTLLNSLYKMRFFDLPSDYTTGYSVFLKNDNTISTSILRMSDTESTSVCFTVPTYRKCISYTSNGPSELESLVQQVLTQTDQLAGL